MKKRNFYLSVIAVVIFVSVYFLGLFLYVEEVKSGGMFSAYVLRGCDAISGNAIDGNLELTQQLLNTVIVEYGRPKDGMRRGMLRDFCEDVGEEDCKYYSLMYCQRVAGAGD